MDPKQEPKYRAEGGRIYNRASGAQIPDDEPVFILRARDTTAVATLLHYYQGHRLCQNDQHADAVLQRLRDFQQFQREHPERMKYPDTAAAPPAPSKPRLTPVGCGDGSTYVVG
jgi:hypothetical protein